MSNIGVANSIFDPKAITTAADPVTGGITELILIISMPFIFIGLGFLIHKFQAFQQCNYFLAEVIIAGLIGIVAIY